MDVAQVSDGDGSEVSQERTDCGWNDRWVELSGLLDDVAGVAAGRGVTCRVITQLHLKTRNYSITFDS